MPSAIERLKAFARVAAAPLSNMERRILAETGLPVVAVATPDPVQARVAAQLLPLALNNDHDGLAAAFEGLFAKKVFSGTGYRTYRVAHEFLMAPLEDTDAASLAAAKQRWRSDQGHPIAAAAYACALLAQIGEVPASGAVNPEVEAEARLAMLCEACGQARAVLAHAGPRGRRHWIWRQADFTLTFAAWSAGCEDEDLLLPAFAAVQTLDPHEFGIYDDRALQLMPHWTGTFEAVDRFARASADRTAARFGDLLYARIYDVVLGHEEAQATHVDTNRMLAAFGDWYERFPGQPLVNRYAAYAHAFGDYETLERLFRGAVREIHPKHWFGHEQPLEAWQSISGGGRETAR